MEIPDLNDIRTFVLIAQAGTLTAAAKELTLPTSTVSRSLTRLERGLGVILMRRGPLILPIGEKMHLVNVKRMHLMV